MVKIVKKCFFGLLTAIVNGSNHAKCMSLSHQRFIIQSTIINLYTNDYSQEFHYCPLDRCVRSCDTQNDSSNKVCIPNKTDLNLRVLNMITGINDLKTLTKHISCECKCRFDGRQCNSDHWWNKDKYRCECKKCCVCEKDCVCNPATCNCENGKYLTSTINDSAIICDEIIGS